MKQIGIIVCERIGDSLMSVNALEYLAKLYAPCEITVFATKVNASFYRDYVYADEVAEFSVENGGWVIVNSKLKKRFDAVFNFRNDPDSILVLMRITYDKAYGYEQPFLSKEACDRIYTGWVPLATWDNVKLRQYTSVSEQCAELIHLVDKDYHCHVPHIAQNELRIDSEKVRDTGAQRGMVLIVPGASYSAKNWGRENFLALAQELKNRGRQLMFVLGADVKAWISEIECAGFGYVLNAAFSTIAGMAFRWRIDTAFAIGNDTGVMHLLKMVDCRSITISANHAHLIWHPYDQTRHVNLHAACADYEACTKAMCENRKCDCFREITVEKVLATFDVMNEECNGGAS